MSDNQPFWSWGWETPQSWGTSCPPRRRWRSCLGNYLFLNFSANNPGNWVFFTFDLVVRGVHPQGLHDLLELPAADLVVAVLVEKPVYVFFKTIFLAFSFGKTPITWRPPCTPVSPSCSSCWRWWVAWLTTLGSWWSKTYWWRAALVLEVQGGVCVLLKEAEKKHCVALLRVKKYRRNSTISLPCSHRSSIAWTGAEEVPNYRALFTKVYLFKWGKCSTFWPNWVLFP